jgi:SAM-dependent methyltransferase
MSEYPEGTHATRRTASAAETVRANRGWWDSAADAYQAEHGGFLGDARFIWGPEGLDEEWAQLLGPVDGLRILEIGCGGGQCGRWLVTQGASAIGLELSGQQLAHSRRLDAHSGITVPVVQADAQHLPFAATAFDLVCSAYGALPFVADASIALSEIARVLRPGGRAVFSVSHPIRWCFLDEPGDEGLYVVSSYFDRRAYVEEGTDGAAVYVEHHRTLGDWVRLITSAGLRLADLVEPEWVPGNQETWGGWSALRGDLIPGTAIFSCVKDA